MKFGGATWRAARVHTLALLPMWRLAELRARLPCALVADVLPCRVRCAQYYLSLNEVAREESY